MHRGLFRARGAAVHPDVVREQLGLAAGVMAAVEADQPARPRVLPVVEQQPVDVLVPGVVLVLVVVGRLLVVPELSLLELVEGGVGLLLGERASLSAP